MAISVFDLFKIGIGPSSSHTVGPMKAALTFARAFEESGMLTQCARVKVELFGSLGATGEGHGSPKAILLGLEGETPEHVDVESISSRVSTIRESSKLNLLGTHSIAFDYEDDLVLHRRKSLPFHPNGMQFTAFRADNAVLLKKIYFSVGGGFIVDESATSDNILIEDPIKLPFPFSSGKQLLAQCKQSGQCISSLMLANEKAWRSEKEIQQGLQEIWKVMHASIEKGCRSEGIMPGGLKVKRRAAPLFRQLKNQSERFANDPLKTLDWVTLYALAVNEENAVGGRIVTAPTNGAAGIIPAVLRYYLEFYGNNDPQVRPVLWQLALLQR